MNERLIDFHLSLLAIRHGIALVILFQYNLGPWINTAYCIFASLYFAHTACQLFQKEEKKEEQCYAEEKEGL